MNTNVNLKFFIIIASVIVMLFLIGTFSLAGEEYSVFMSLTSDSTLNKGEIVTVNVNLSNINAGNGIDVIVAKLNYDTNIFEILTSNEFISNNNWNITYAPNTNMLTAISSTKVTQNESVFTVKFKVKSTINVDSTTITLQNITASGGRLVDGGTDDISVNSTSITIKKPVQEVISSNHSVGMLLTSDDSLKEGQIVTVYANLNNISAGNGIDVATAKLNYDSNVFEMITSNEFNSNTGWRISYASSTNILTAIKDNKVTKNETIFTIKFKVKSTINVNSTTIILQNITVSGGRIVDGGTDDISVNNASVTLNRIVEVVPTSTNNIVKVSNAANVDMPIPTANSVKDEVTSTDMDISSVKDEITSTDIDINSDIDTDMTISSKLDNTNIVEESKVADESIYKEQVKNQNSDNIQNTIIGSASSVSFLSICYILIRKIKFGI